MMPGVLVLFDGLVDDGRLGGFGLQPRAGRSLKFRPRTRVKVSLRIKCVGNRFDQDWDVIYQIPFRHEGVRDVAGNRHPATGSGYILIPGRCSA